LASWACYIYSPKALGFEQGADLGCEPNYILQHSIVDRKYMPHGRFMSKNEIDLQNANKLFSHLRADPTQDRFKQAIESIQGKRVIIWCSRNNEEELFKRTLENCRVVNGSTPIEKRVEYVDMFRKGEIDKLISKPSVLGFGVNIPEAECHLYSGYNFSFEELYQAVRRSHRYGRKGILDVYVPVSEPERPIWRLLNRKIQTFQKDVLELQSRFFNN
jgi:superfamily II DNA or RNA helicase